MTNSQLNNLYAAFDMANAPKSPAQLDYARRASETRTEFANLAIDYNTPESKARVMRIGEMLARVYDQLS